MWRCFIGGMVLTVSTDYRGSHPPKSCFISHKTRTLSYTAAETFNLLYLLSFLFEIFRQILLILADIFSIQHVLCLPFALCILYAHFRASFGNWLIDWLIDLHWIRALMVPMHLGLTDSPFLSHNLVSVQENPVPLPKFQTAPRLKS
jgi:hypothetical protein